MNIETFTGTRNVLGEISEKVFGVKILTDGNIKEKQVDFNSDDESELISEFDEYTISRSDKIIKKIYEIKDASYIVAIRYITPIYSNEENYYEIKNLYLKNENDKEELKFIKKQLKKISKKLHYNNFKIKKVLKKNK